MADETRTLALTALQIQQLREALQFTAKQPSVPVEGMRQLLVLDTVIEQQLNAPQPTVEVAKPSKTR